ncbi:MAG: hypothetical protein FJ191_01645 [Gammaproteobacteria bacterium]|nr:hypothetical protein [Gammaproteobacteria bacterium]
MLPQRSLAGRLCVAGCVLGLLAAPPAALGISEQEQRARIDFETRRLEQQIANSDELYADPELDAYLQQILEQLFPERPAELRVRTYRNPDFNAFAVATGGIYFHTGALLRLTDEAQLASVLGHEGTHVTADHMFRSIRAARQVSAVANIGAVAAASAGYPGGLVQLAGYSSMMGFSREHEREADRGGFDRMVQAGYDARAGAEAFAQLERELLARHIAQPPFFFASHPQVRERVQTLGEFATAGPPEGRREAARYRAATLRARLDALGQLHRGGDGKVLVFLLADEHLLDTLPPEARYYLAEGYRLRAEKARRAKRDRRGTAEIEAQQMQDAARALEEYQRTLELAPDFAPTYQALAMHHYRQGDRSQALALLRRFVELSPDPRQSGYARQYIETLSRELEQP